MIWCGFAGLSGGKTIAEAGYLIAGLATPVYTKPPLYLHHRIEFKLHYTSMSSTPTLLDCVDMHGDPSERQAIRASKYLIFLMDATYLFLTCYD